MQPRNQREQHKKGCQSERRCLENDRHGFEN